MSKSRRHIDDGLTIAIFKNLLFRAKKTNFDLQKIFFGEKVKFQKFNRYGSPKNNIV